MFRNGKTMLGEFLFLKVGPSKEPPVRFGFVVPSGTFKKAVQRNRLKRVLSETAREEAGKLKPRDILVVLTKKALPATTQELAGDLRELLKKLTL